MDIALLFPFVLLIGAMFLMTRSAKKKQQQAAAMRDTMQPGTGVRTIGGMYATVKEVGEDTALLEVAPGVHAVYAKNAIGAVLTDDEYNRIVHGATADELGVAGVPDDASSLTPAEESDDSRIDLGKKDVDAEPGPAAEGTAPEPKKTDGEDGTK
ncbi:preprotein translocase subunit YajC [Streptomyces sp. NPDC060194]|uniref:preprotein translocase subunit YajC n=1 Tax=Streptomyces sp. NPDC060194 TaxID=3347069 RepID=UPI003658DACE